MNLSVVDIDKLLPRTEFLLRKTKRIEEALEGWFKKNIYNQGDDYYSGITEDGRWFIGYVNDYPLQHGKGSEHIFTLNEFKEATKGIK